MRPSLKWNRSLCKERDAKYSLIALVLCAMLRWSADAAALQAFRVRHVIDGDTVVLETGRHVRYIGIDAPEIFHKKQTAQPFALDAKAYNQELTQSGWVVLEFDKDRQDTYHRWLAYVYDKNKNLLNQRMLLKGYAYCLVIFPNVKYREKLLQAQRSAMAKRLGIWQYWGERKETVLGNRSTKRFHRPTCPYGKRTAKQNRVALKSVWEAFWEGYAPCKHCLPVRPLTP